jgi:alkylated DNA nucleotide flippase Atl1
MQFGEGAQPTPEALDAILARATVPIVAQLEKVPPEGAPELTEALVSMMLGAFLDVTAHELAREQKRMQHSLPSLVFLLVCCIITQSPTWACAADLSEVSARMTQWRDAQRDFLARATSTAHETSLLRDLPGWQDLERIMRANRSIEHFEGRDAAARKTQAALVEWELKWQTSWVRVVNAYNDLRQRSLDLERERLQLLTDHREIHGACLTAVMQATPGSGRNPQKRFELELWANLCGMFRDQAATLQGYRLDDLGLYGRDTR